MRTALPNFHEAERFESGDHFERFQYWEFRHGSGHLHFSGANELRFQPRLAVVKNHPDDFDEVLV